MASPIVFNGVTYDSVEAMPESVRQAYEKDELNRRGLAGLDVVLAERHSVQRGGGAVKQTFIVNGKTYGTLDEMPADAREAYEKGMAMLGAGGPGVQKSDIKFTFTINGPHVHFGKSFGSPGVTDPSSSTAPTPSPIQPASMESGFRIALVVAACVAIGLFWFLTRAH